MTDETKLLPDILVSTSDSEMVCVSGIHKDCVQANFLITFLDHHQFTEKGW